MTAPDPDALSPAVQEALDALLPAAERSGDLAADLERAAAISNERRRSNPRHGGVVLAALHDPDGAAGLSWEEIHQRTGWPIRTARARVDDVARGTVTES